MPLKRLLLIPHRWTSLPRQCCYRACTVKYALSILALLAPSVCHIHGDVCVAQEISDISRLKQQYVRLQALARSLLRAHALAFLCAGRGSGAFRGGKLTLHTVAHACSQCVLLPCCDRVSELQERVRKLEEIVHALQK